MSASQITYHNYGIIVEADLIMMFLGSPYGDIGGD
jgi:hypothetical protein